MNVTHQVMILPALLLVAMMLVPNRIANARVVVFRRLMTLLAATQFAISTTLAAANIVGFLPVVHWTFWDFSNDAALALTVHCDNLACLMLMLVSFVGWVICQYSVRYLDGEATQGRYFRWTAFAIGSVSLMVISGNLLMFMATWVMTSTALHKLLLHYGQRPAAKRAAWTKFIISRLGDIALVAAIALIYDQFQTLDFQQLFAAIASPSLQATEPTIGTTLVPFLLAIGAITKSAQFPFHTWLPLTMETPTPVSALMHAGIVNAGGYLIIRTSPLLVIQPWAMTLLAVVGGFTACFAAIVMMTQTSVKKKLAYSTIAQMGFMLLQCGLGAFSAAMLHILAHSLYKAHAFLSSGSVMQQRAATNGGAVDTTASTAWLPLVAVGVILAFLVEFSFLSFGINPLVKPGGLFLGGVLCLALTHWVGQVMRSGRQRLMARAMSLAAVLCFVYVASFVAVDKLIAASVPAHAVPALSGLLTGLLLAGFAGLFWLHIQLSSAKRPAWLDGWYIHASNGFYIENNLRRIMGRLLIE
ncbi:MAG: proton-conducting transporter membrane subunit [Pirellulaceae bacterium]|nr:proton-conducting transporter membrane subunit [Pirellulaceae bacterium]